MYAFNRSKVRGFTLTELTIVLGVAGLIIGAIWSATATVMNHKRAYLATQQIGTVVQNIREYYMNAQGIPGCGVEGFDFTSTLDSNGLFPNEMRTKSGGSVFINSPYATVAGGSFRVRGSSCSGTASRFQVVLTNLSQAACQRLLLSAVNYRDHSIGVTKVCAGTGAGAPCHTAGSSANYIDVTCTNGVCDLDPALTLAGAASKCNGNDAAYDGTSEVGWEFDLRK